ncbi:two-component system nitrogen regulation sensor histidine kinase GlnL [Azospirillum agricola]|uniref:two-component system sensor histidine kinase NtrB n=1 Tax=Azospirillum agricola TaxID=1720247 RepID=UPI001AE8F814|nr:ATP-binding protein [Azospirillum agricola]MBP2230754.1 two-component system nitrogen regulation sensor histidine kinase GlnL [Azospirillum agricola]
MDSVPTAASAPRRRPRAGGARPGKIDASVVLNGLPDPVLVVDGEGEVRFVNLEAQEFFDLSASVLEGMALAELLPPDSPVMGLIEQVRRGSRRVSQEGVVIDTPRIGPHHVTVQVAAMGDPPDHVLVTVHERSIARKIDNSLTHRHAARSVTAMAAMLAHEVKNPLSGIRGAAQLLEENAHDQDRVLTRLICDEADRIVALVNRMEVFSDERPLERTAVNIHTVLEHVRTIAQSGFARKIRFVERYDPSLPPVYGNRDQLVQVFLNLIKNAAEAAPETGGEITLTTAYQHGVRMALPGGDTRLHLPLQVSVQDNGDGIPEDLQSNLFDPFVTSKVNGTGLGLALVAKLIGDHGGTIEFDSQPRRTVFKVSLPMYDESQISQAVSRVRGVRGGR